MKVLRDFFERVRKANLSFKHSKCKVGFPGVDFLGHTFQRTQLDHGKKLLVEFWTQTDQK